MGKPLHLLKPLTFMNASGEVLAPALRYAEAAIPDVVVVCDSLDLPAGTCRLRKRGSSGGHRGLESMIRHAGTSDITRLVIGIGRPASGGDIVSYVLGRPDGAEAAVLEAAVERAADALVRLSRENAEQVMNDVNRTDVEQS